MEDFLDDRYRVPVFFFENIPYIIILILWMMYMTKLLENKNRIVMRYTFKSPISGIGYLPTLLVGSLHIFVGPMFANKTSSMLKKVTEFADISKQRPLIINHESDKERSVGNGITGKGISSHSSQYGGLSSKVDHIYTGQLCMVDVSKHNVIGIDEIQLYPDLYDTVQYWLSLGKHIYCSGLDGSFRGDNIGQVHKLLPISDTFTKLSAVCHLCHQEHSKTGNITLPTSFVPAPFTIKIGGDMTKEIEQGGQDKYLPACRYHFYQQEQD